MLRLIFFDQYIRTGEWSESTMDTLKLLFLCTGNSGRSQMAHDRRVRDEIRAFVETLPASLGRAQP
jgi:hypothetical protein